MGKHSSRRKVFIAVVGVACLAVTRSAFATDSALAAKVFVKTLGGQLVDIINSDMSPSEKKIQIRPFLDRMVDVDDVARYCLGTYWRTSTPEQKQHYLDLFHAMFTNSIADRLGDYRGVTFSIGRASPSGDDMAVETVIVRPNQTRANVLWIVNQASGGPKVVDMIAEGVSLRLTERQDYVSYIERNNGNIDALIRALTRQIERHG
ncbi:MlaC/ttg2D family ABC transporter substrate-binding protein [Gluconacetobacter aggeris]|uniref:MlaC/ttg2D family ABC transporter substrate-binding protein n=1 Tax=Gluconacetobacter aggeris TaxID=1286186 RepID=UPI001FEC133F|nr:ABC transporter substrate-binding protein [Gluconacetobacter aggeris]